MQYEISKFTKMLAFKVLKDHTTFAEATRLTIPSKNHQQSRCTMMKPNFDEKN